MTWPEEFSPVDEDDRRLLEAELLRELGPHHPLNGIPAGAVGRRFDQDDVLFELHDGSERVAEVHLTWTGTQEKPPWPETTIFSSRDAWIKARGSEQQRAPWH